MAAGGRAVLAGGLGRGAKGRHDMVVLGATGSPGSRGMVTSYDQVGMSSKGPEHRAEETRACLGGGHGKWFEMVGQERGTGQQRKVRHFVLVPIWEMFSQLGVVLF